MGAEKGSCLGGWAAFENDKAVMERVALRERTRSPAGEPRTVAERRWLGGGR